MGGSQGGLLVGGAFTHAARTCSAPWSRQVPLADMRRFTKLLAGACWMAEYGDPDMPEQWAYIQTWSPYHLLKKDAKYPTPFSGRTPATTACTPATRGRWWRG